MEPSELKKKIDELHRKGVSREDVVTLISALPIDGDSAKAFEYANLLYKKDITTNESYIALDKKDNPILDLARLTSDILSENTFATLNDNDDILVYRDGYYQSGGARYIKAQCQNKVGITPLLSEHKINEIIGHIAR